MGTPVQRGHQQQPYYDPDEMFGYPPEESQEVEDVDNVDPPPEEEFDQQAVDQDEDRWLEILGILDQAVATGHWAPLYETVVKYRFQFATQHTFYETLQERLLTAKTKEDFIYIQRLSLAEQILNPASRFARIIQAMDHFDRFNFQMTSQLLKDPRSNDSTEVGEELGRMAVEFRNNPLVAMKFAHLLVFLVTPESDSKKLLQGTRI